MRRQRRQSGGSREGRERRDPDSYHVTSQSDRGYAEQARRRLAQQARRRWATRLAILALLAFAAWVWGGDVVRAFRVQASMTGEEVRQAGDHIRGGAERRAGADLVEEGAP